MTRTTVYFNGEAYGDDDAEVALDAFQDHEREGPAVVIRVGGGRLEVPEGTPVDIEVYGEEVDD